MAGLTGWKRRSRCYRIFNGTDKGVQIRWTVASVQYQKLQLVSLVIRTVYPCRLGLRSWQSRRWLRFQQ